MDPELKKYLDARFAEMDAKFASKQDLVALADRLVEKMRDMQTELLGFAAGR
ncbi:MAG: hypothetical protein ABSB35_22355 [Bryobacteraceae bacterium]|jgi:DNA-binding IclR family transcriptional regulator